MKMIDKFTNNYTYHLFRMKRIPAGYEVTLNGKKFDQFDQKMYTAIWTGIAATLLVAAFRLLLPAVVYALTSLGLHATISMEAHDMMAGCIWDICRALKDMMIEFTWIGGFMDTIHEYKFIQLLITAVSGFGFAKAVNFFAYACVQCKKHFRKETNNQTIPFETARRSRRHTGRRVG